jgi:hypothetical protein
MAGIGLAIYVIPLDAPGIFIPASLVKSRRLFNPRANIKNISSEDTRIQGEGIKGKVVSKDVFKGFRARVARRVGEKMIKRIIARAIKGKQWA